MGTYTKITTPPAYCSHSRDDLIGVPRPSRNRVSAVPQSVFLSGVGSKLGSLLSAVYADVRVRAFQFDTMRHRSFNRPNGWKATDAFGASAQCTARAGSCCRSAATLGGT